MNEEIIPQTVENIETALQGGIRLPDDELDEDEIYLPVLSSRKTKKAEPTKEVVEVTSTELKKIIVESAKNASELIDSVPAITPNNITTYYEEKQFKDKLFEFVESKYLRDTKDRDLAKLADAWNKTTHAQLIQVITFNNILKNIIKSNQGIERYSENAIDNWTNQYKAFVKELETIKNEKYEDGKESIKTLYDGISDICKTLEENTKKAIQLRVEDSERVLDVADRIEERLKSSLEKKYFAQRVGKITALYETNINQKIKNALFKVIGSIVVSGLLIVGSNYLLKGNTQTTQVGVKNNGRS